MPTVPASVSIPVVVVASVVPVGGFLATALGARAAGLRDWLRLGLSVAAVLVGWGAIVCLLAALEIGWGAPYEYTSALQLATYLTVPLAGVLALRRAPRLRAALGNRSALWRLASFEVARALGVVFLVLHARGELPDLFVYPAAWGDVAIAVTAPVAAWAAWYREAEIRRPGSRWRRAFIGWNVLGLLEHAAAVGLGILHFPGYLQVFDGEPSTVAFAELPMMLFPAYMVPFACLLHLVMIDVVRRPPAAVAPTPGARPAVGPAVGT